MAITFNFKRGTSLPSWDWMATCPIISDPGTSTCYDGVRNIYAIIQSGTTTAGTASTTSLYQFDTFTNGWTPLGSPTAGNAGMSIQYDPNRNVLYMTTGASLTSWQVYNLNTTSVTICNTSCSARTFTTMAPVLPILALNGSSLCLPSWGWINTPSFPNPMTQVSGVNLTAASGGSTTNVKSTNANAFPPTMVGMQIQFTSGTNSGNRAIITAVGSATSVTVAPALTGTATVGDTFQTQLPTGTATSGAAGSITDSAQSWPVNQYANMDVVILSGTGAGQRRRVASNTATALTLSGSVTGNSNTGNWSTNPDATSVYQLWQSGDFLYYASANATATVWSLDLSSTAPASWVALTSAPSTLSTGSSLLDLRGSGACYLFALRGSSSNTIYNYNIGTNAWTAPSLAIGTTFTTGAGSDIMYNHHKVWIAQAAQTYNIQFDLTTGIGSPAPMTPYAISTAYDGQRITYVKTADGADWIYILRAGGQQLFRTPIEWGD